jgi:hypothetical protein
MNPRKAARRQLDIVITVGIPPEDTSPSGQAAHKPTRFAA